MEFIHKIETLHSTISRLLTLSGSPGLSLGVVHNGELLHTAHFGRRHVHDPAPPNDYTVHHIASLVKLLSASVVAMLVHEGKLTWDIPIREYLPEFRQRTDDIGKKATLRDLLSFRTGLAVSHASFGQQLAEFLISRNETARTAALLPAVGPFRKQFIYSQWNYSLITDIVEEVTGKSFATYAREMLLDRLKMDETTFDHMSGDNISAAHAILDNGTACTILPPGVTDETGFAASVGCKASLNDVLKMYKSFMETYIHQQANHVDSSPGSPWKYTRRILEPHSNIGNSDLDQLAYCLGLYKTKLPGNLSVASLNQQLLSAARIPVPDFGANNRGLDVFHHTAAVPGFHGSRSWFRPPKARLLF